MSETLARKVLASALDTGADANLVSNAQMFAVAPLARMGRTDDAMRILLRCVEDGVVPGYDDWLLREPDLQVLRSDPRFAEVLAAARDGAALMARILGEARARGELPALPRGTPPGAGAPTQRDRTQALTKIVLKAHRFRSLPWRLRTRPIRTWLLGTGTILLRS
jgi:hypothetical protein